MNTATRLLSVLWLVTLFFTSASAASIRKLTFATGYIPNVQFTPFYVAIERGYFDSEHLEVKLDYTSGAEPLKLVAQGKFDFGTADGDALFAAAANHIPLISIFQLYQHNPIAVYTLASTTIKKIDDLSGHTVGIPGLFGASYVGWRLAVSKDATLEKANLKVIGFTQVQALLAKHVDAAIGYENNEPLILESRGKGVRVFPLSQVAWLPGSGIVTSRSLLEKEPETAKAFLRALQRGLQDTVNNPRASFESIRAKYLPQIRSLTQVQEQEKVLEKSVEFWRPVKANRVFGEHDFSKLAEASSMLFKAKIIPREVKPEECFSNDYLPSAKK